MYKFFKWLDEKASGFAPNYPDYAGRLKQYHYATEEIYSLKWEPMRYEADIVRIELRNPVYKDKLDQIVQEVSSLLDDGYMSITFFLGEEAVQNYVIMNGKEYQPTTTK